MREILKVENLTKTYRSGETALTVLKDVSFSVQEGESLSIVGPSGSGKTTLLGLAAGLDRATSGSVYIYDVLLNDLDEDARASLRNRHIGFIFQNFQLVPTLSALENVMVPLELRGDKAARKVAQNLLDRVGLGDRMRHYPSQLSGGEQQRVAMARAFCNQPSLLFADEPTGNLDDSTGTKVEDLLFELNREQGTTLVIVTHDIQLAEKTGRIIRLRGGEIESDLVNQAAVIQA